MPSFMLLAQEKGVSKQRACVRTEVYTVVHTVHIKRKRTIQPVSFLKVEIYGLNLSEFPSKNLKLFHPNPSKYFYTYLCIHQNI